MWIQFPSLCTFADSTSDVFFDYLGRKLFGKGGQDFQKKSLQQLEEDRQAWRKREEARLQIEKEEFLRKQEDLSKRSELVSLFWASLMFQERIASERRRQEETQHETTEPPVSHQPTDGTIPQSLPASYRRTRNTTWIDSSSWTSTRPCCMLLCELCIHS